MSRSLRSPSWLLRTVLVCAILFLLFTGSTGVDAAKKKKKKSIEVPAAKATAGATQQQQQPPPVNAYATPEVNAAAAAAAAAASAPSTASTATSTPTPSAAATTTTTETTGTLPGATSSKPLTAAQRVAVEQRRQAAAARAKQLASARTAKTTRQAKARVAAKQRAESLALKKAAADTPEAREAGTAKLKSLLKLSGETSSRVISLDTPSYNRFVNEGPRPYHLLIQYTALTSQHQCMYCHLANDAIVPVAQAHYERAREKTARVLASNSTADIPNADLPVFFVTVDMAKNSFLFKELHFNSAPVILFAPPRLSTKSLKPAEFVKQLPQKYRFNLQSTMSASDYQAFINKLAGTNVQLDQVKPGMGQLLVVLCVLFGLAYVGIRYGYTILMRLREVRGVRFLAICLGCGFYCWCIGGGMYNIIRGTQFAGMDRGGSVSYISHDPRDQFSAEGLIIGGLNLLAAFMLVLVNTRAFESAPSMAARGGKPTAVQHLVNAVSPLLSASLAIALFVCLWFQIVDIYTRKNGHYRRGFVWRM